MGVNNRQRRAAKRRREHRSGRASGTGAPRQSAWDTPPTGGGDSQEHVSTLYVVETTLRAMSAGDGRRLEQGVALLAERPDADPCLAQVLRDLIDVLTRHGWQADELPRAAARLGQADDDGWLRRAASGAGVGLADSRDRHGAVRQAIQVIANLRSLPAVPSVDGAGDLAGGGGDGGGLDEKLLARVRALLAKAESTTFPEEAEALSAKAQELITRHALDVAALAAGHDGDSRGFRPGWRRVWFDRPYVDGKSYLFQQVAHANRCAAVFEQRLGFSTAVGAGADLDIVEMLFTSLLVQATRAMVGAGTQRDRYGRSRTRSFRASFLVGFASRIGERLQQAAATATEDAGEEVRAAALPVLFSQADAVQDALRGVFPEMFRSGVSASHAGGYLAGQVAADRATLAAHELPADG